MPALAPAAGAGAGGRATAIVVGGGIGGLATAIRLLAGGRRVTVLERAAAPGGKMRQLTVGGRLCAIVGQAPIMRAVRITRAGSLDVDVTGLLQTKSGHTVLGDGGPINIPPER